jgi:hypothetical protein
MSVEVLKVKERLKNSSGSEETKETQQEMNLN